MARRWVVSAAVLGQAADSPGQEHKLILPGESLTVAGRPAFILLPPKEKRATPQPCGEKGDILIFQVAFKS